MKNQKSWKDDNIEQTDRLKIEPWLLFGTAFVIAIASILFAIGAWVIHGGRAADSILHASKLELQLEEEQESVKKIEDQNVILQDRVSALTLEKSTLEQESKTLIAETDSLKRQVNGMQQTLESSSQQDNFPTDLPIASLKEILGTNPEVITSVFLSDTGNQVNQANLSQGALLEHLKQGGRSLCGLSFNDNADTQLTMSVVAVTSNEYTAIGIMLELRQDWKVPGKSEKKKVTVWRRHMVGITSPERAPVYAETIVTQLLTGLSIDL